MSSALVRIGLLGLGRAGNFHLQSLRAIETTRLVSVYDIDQNRAQKVAARFGCDAADSPNKLIERTDVDAVIVATPTDSHYPYVQQCLNQCKPVLTEKPLGRELAQIDDCFRLAESNDTPLFVAFQRRFDPSFASLVQAIRSGELGQLHYVRSVSRDNPIPSPDYIRTSGGIFHDCMVHDLDMVVHIIGEHPEHVSAFGSSFIPEIGKLDDFDNVVATLAFPNGVTASIDINRQSAYGYDQRIEAFGEHGMLLADNHHPTSVTRASQRGFARPQAEFSFPTRYRDAYRIELEQFAQCALGECEVPITHTDVRTNHLLANQVEQAAREKRVIAVKL
ncbi:MAG: Gfo/Idh/MocA family oxidoreductase [Pirellulaceae bacterium]|nr:Gfo/Idh/MocA family oxidoreductase [Pirellulaceae bacterium]